MLERCSHPSSDVIYNGFSGGGTGRPGAAASATAAAPRPVARSRRRSRSGLKVAFTVAGLGVVAVAALPVIGHLRPDLVKPLPLASAPAAAPTPPRPAPAPDPDPAGLGPPPAGLEAAAPAVEAAPPAAVPAAPVVPTVPAIPPRRDALIETATPPPAQLVRRRAHPRPKPARSEYSAVARSRAAAATTLANLDEAAAPQSTLSDQAAALAAGH